MKKTMVMTIWIAAVMFAACEPSAKFVRLGDGEGLAPSVIDGQINPFEDPFNSGDGLDSTGGKQTQDRFTQSQVGATDILMVIDSSGSMRDDQVALKTHINLFVTELQKAAVDYKIAVITTAANDPKALSNICGEFITPSNIAKLPECILKAGTQGSGHEVATEAARRALDPMYPRGPWNLNATPAPLNANFLRAEASLNVVVLSDEEDQFEVYDEPVSSWKQLGFVQSDITALRSEMASQLDDGGKEADSTFAFFPKLSNYVSFFRGLKSTGKDGFRFHSIVGTTDDPTKCSAGNTPAAEIGQRYIALSNLTGGGVGEICNDIAPILTSLGLQATGLKKCFALKKVPTQTNSIQVKVDGSSLAAGQFNFVSTGNQVCLESIPAAGKEVVIDYK